MGFRMAFLLLFLLLCIKLVLRRNKRSLIHDTTFLSLLLPHLLPVPPPRPPSSPLPPPPQVDVMWLCLVWKTTPETVRPRVFETFSLTYSVKRNMCTLNIDFVQRNMLRSDTVEYYFTNVFIQVRSCTVTVREMTRFI